MTNLKDPDGYVLQGYQKYQNEKIIILRKHTSTYQKYPKKDELKNVAVNLSEIAFLKDT